MAIFGIVGHLLDQWFVAGYPGICEMFAKLADEVCRLLCGQADPVFERPNRFRDDFVRRLRNIQPRGFGESEQRVPERCLHQDARVQNRRKVGGHSSSAPSGRTTLSYVPASISERAMLLIASWRAVSRRRL